MKAPTDAEVRAKFMEHVKKLEAQGVAGDKGAIRSLCCMVLLIEGFTCDPGDGEIVEVKNVIDFEKWRNAA